MFPAFTVNLSQISIKTWAQNSDAAVNQVLIAENAPFEAFVSVYQKDPVTKVDCKYGAPMGRSSRNLDHSTLETPGLWKAKRVKIDGSGYDKGGSYWGLRRPGESIFAVQDGMGNIAFVDATSKDHALKVAQEA